MTKVYKIFEKDEETYPDEPCDPLKWTPDDPDEVVVSRTIAPLIFMGKRQWVIVTYPSSEVPPTTKDVVTEDESEDEESDDDDSDDIFAHLNSMKKKDLIRMAKEMGLSHKGTKAEIVDRIYNASAPMRIE